MTRAKVLDRSHWDPITDVNGYRQEVASGAVVGMIGKVSEGPGGADRTWSGNRDIALHVGTPYVGGYHFWKQSASPTANRDAFARNYGDHALCNLPPSIDAEDTSASFDRNAVSDHLHQTSDLFRAEYGVNPILYTGPWWWQPHVGDAAGWAAALALWLSGYTSHAPSPPHPWNVVSGWQFTDQDPLTSNAPGDATWWDDSVLAALASHTITPPNFPPGDTPMSAAEVAEINAHTDAKANEVINAVTLLLAGEKKGDLTIEQMVRSMFQGNYGETAGFAKGDLTFLDKRTKKP